MVGPLDHVMLRVEDLDESLAWYRDNVDYEEVSRWEADTFTNVHLAPADAGDAAATLELTYNHDGRSYEMGDGWGHVAMRVEDVEAVYAELLDNGVPDYRPPAENPGYAFVKDPDGHEIEIVEREGAPRWSLDHTMIRVADADAALGWWTRKMEYDEVGRWEADTFANYFVEPSDAADEAMSVELTYNDDGRTYDLGDAWGHLAVGVPDLEEAWETLVERGAEDYRDPESCDYNYAFTTDQDGHEVEVVER